jgi:hypothetical protein
MADEIISLLSDNTGCHEDLEIFIKLSKPLKDRGLLSEEQYSRIMNSKGIGRWM